MLREGFDLDIAVYWPSTDNRSLAQIFTTTHQALLATGYIVQPKTVALRLPYDGGFHVDVVPGRAHDASYRYATLFKNEVLPSSLQTSLKVHIEAVKDAGLAPIVRLLKLWRRRHGVKLSTFMLEILAGRALAGQRRDDYDRALWAVLNFVALNMHKVRLEDPANTNNIIAVGQQARLQAARLAAQSRDSRDIARVVW